MNKVFIQILGNEMKNIENLAKNQHKYVFYIDRVIITGVSTNVFDQKL